MDNGFDLDCDADDDDDDDRYEIIPCRGPACPCPRRPASVGALLVSYTLLLASACLMVWLLAVLLG